MMFNLLKPLTQVLDQVIDHYFPDSMSEAEKVEAKRGAARMATELALAENSEFHQFMLEYEGRAADLPPFIQILRAVIRPVLTIFVVALMGYLVWTGQPVPPILEFFIKIISIFWFGERAVRNVLPCLQPLIGKKKE